MMRTALLLGALVVLASPALVRAQDDAESAGESEVLVLGADNFDDAIAANDVLLVEFYAPWCGHCKKLEPEYDTASVELAKHGLKIAKVNADEAENKDLAQKYGIRGFPTLKLFRSGKFSNDYEGARSADAIVSYVKKQSQPAYQEIESKEDALAFATKDKVTLVGCFSEKGSDEYEAFVGVAEVLRNEFTFGFYIGADSAAVCGEIAEGATHVAMTKDFDDGNVAYTGDAADEADIEQFARKESVPLIDEVGPNNYKMYSDSKLPLAYIFVSKQEKDQVDTFTKKFTPIAKETRGTMNWVWIDSVQYGRHGERLGLSGSVFPAVAIEKFTEDNAHYAYPEDAELSFESVKEWVDKFTSGDLSPTVKSEDVPSAEERAASSVYKLVASTFDEDVVSSEKDFFVEFYAPWCGHCKKLAPTWETLGSALKKQGDDDKIAIAAMDATANDVDPKYGVRGFPTLKYFKAGAKDSPIDYQGDRSEADLIKFIKDNSAAGVEIVVSAADSDSEAADEKDEL
jgi:protein disulfide-isomerase A1